MAAAVVADLERRGHVDDAVFARHWVETRAARGIGPERLRAELRTRGVPVRVADAAVASVAADDALERARTAGRRRLPALLRGRRERAPDRLRDYLLRRGYSGAIALRVVRELLDPLLGE